MAPTSFGIAPFKVFVVSDAAKKAALQAVSYGQAQVGQASHVLIFAAANDPVAMGERMIAANKLDEYNAAYAGMIRGAMAGHAAGGAAWPAKQAYIALGFGLAAAAELRIASCPMEGFSAEGVAKEVRTRARPLPASAAAASHAPSTHTH